VSKASRTGSWTRSERAMVSKATAKRLEWKCLGCKLGAIELRPNGSKPGDKTEKLCPVCNKVTEWRLVKIG